MKKSGILNKELMAELTGLGHLDTFVVCDAGFPIPVGAKKIDLAIAENLPTFTQVLKAILNEVIVEEITIADETKNVSPALFGEIEAIFKNQIKKQFAFDDFLEKAYQAKFYVRTGDFTPYANIVLQSASGVRQYNEAFDVGFDTVL